MENNNSLRKLREPFPEHLISQRPNPTKKQTEEMKNTPMEFGAKCSICGLWHHRHAPHLAYVGHAALTHRLLEVDEDWNWEPLAKDPQGLPLFDTNGGLWIKLTVCGVTRLGYGNAAPSTFKEIGSREKEVIGDALRNAAMRFGAALELWHKGSLEADDEEAPTKNLQPTQQKPLTNYATKK